MRTKLIVFLLSVCGLFICAKANSQQLTLPSVFADNMVLQQKTKVNLWGTSAAGDKIEIKASWGKTAVATADANGKWKAQLETVAAGGPYSLTVKGSKSTIELKNVLLGEIWICSGQSNMEMPLKGWMPNNPVQNSADEIASATNTNIRMFTVPRAISVVPQTNCKGNWFIESPQTAGDFSATAFFFAKKLYAELKVPIGLLFTSWGGTPAESWIPGDVLSTNFDFTDKVKALSSAEEQEAQLHQWLENHPKVDLSKKKQDADLWKNLEFSDAACATEAISDAEWNTMKLPVSWESTAVGEFDGVIWFRKWVDIPASWSGKDLVIALPGIDDMDRTYFNGQLVGASEVEGLWSTPRNYTVPAALLKPGKNLIAVRVLDNQGGGGINGTVVPMRLQLKDDASQFIDISGEWAYQPVAELRNKIFFVFDAAKRDYQLRPKLSVALGSGTPTVLYNAMIAPLVPYTIKGAIWYQGETNVGRGKQYETLFPMLINSWRKNFGQGDFPFYFAQIAPYIYSGVDNSESAEIRNAQRLTLSLKNTGMAVLSDIGNVKDIHPANKEAVGNRLAFWTLDKDYGKKIIPSGPLYQSMKIEGNKIRLSFTYTGKGLMAKDGILKGFEIAGADGKYIPAEAAIDNNTVVVSANGIAAPVSVRYGWTNGFEGSLFNQNGLPASCFSTK
jgi:sialate O-acetylesterase